MIIAHACGNIFFYLISAISIHAPQKLLRYQITSGEKMSDVVFSNCVLVQKNKVITSVFLHVILDVTVLGFFYYCRRNHVRNRSLSACTGISNRSFLLPGKKCTLEYIEHSEINKMVRDSKVKDFSVLHQYVLENYADTIFCCPG